MRFVVPWLVALACVPGLACGQEESMDLELKLDLDRPSYLVHESIRGTATLLNGGAAPVDVVSMQLDPAVVVFELLGADGKSIGNYRWVEAEQRLGENFPGALEPMTTPLAPGERDEVTHDLLQLRELLAPGDYQLRAHYRTATVEATSPTVEFQVRASKAHDFALGHDWSTGQPYHLVVAWLDEDAGKTLLMQGATFDVDHRMFARVSRMEGLPLTAHARQLGLSRSLEEAKTGAATVVWGQDDQLHWIAVGGKANAMVGQSSVDLPGWRRIGEPWRDDATSTMVAVADASGNRVRALALLADGSASTVSEAETGGAERLSFVHHLEAGTFLFHAKNPGGRGEVHWKGMGRTKGGGRLVDAPSRVMALAAGFDRARSPFVVAALARDGKDGGVSVQARVFAGEGFALASDGPFWEFPANAPLQLLLGTDGAVFAVMQDGQGRTWRGDPDGAVTELEGELLPRPGAAFLVGRGGVPFALGAAPEGHARLFPIVPFAPPEALE